MKKLIIEGTDLIGKTTLCNSLKDTFDVSDRLLELTQQINKDGSLKSEDKIKEIVSNINKDTTLLILITTQTDILEERLSNRISEGTADEFDKECVLYNYSYIEIMKLIYPFSNVICLNIDNMSTEDIKIFLIERFL